VSGSEVLAYVQYELDRPACTLDLLHTFTNPAHRGKGLAAKVVTAAFEYAKESNLKVIPSCTYIPVFVRKNPKWKPFVVSSPDEAAAEEKRRASERANRQTNASGQTTMISPLGRLICADLRPTTRGMKKNAKKFVEHCLNTPKTVVVFVKTTCPRCVEAEKLLLSLIDGKKVSIIKLDAEFPGTNATQKTEKHGTSLAAVQDELWDKTGCRTVPRVFIGGKCLGGYDDIVNLHKKGLLAPKL